MEVPQFEELFLCLEVIDKNIAKEIGDRYCSSAIKLVERWQEYI